jgi:hypothetical protein
VSTEEKRGYVYSATLTDDTLANLLKEHFNRACAIVRRVDDTNVVLFPSADTESLPGVWTEGQIFNDVAELRWRKTGNGYAALLLTETTKLSDNFQPLSESPLSIVAPSSNEKHGFLLWGTRYSQSTGAFWEARIPRSLQYPVKTKGEPPRLVYWHYLDREAVRWIRLVKLEEV